MNTVTVMRTRLFFYGEAGVAIKNSIVTTIGGGLHFIITLERCNSQIGQVSFTHILSVLRKTTFGSV